MGRSKTPEAATLRKAAHWESQCHGMWVDAYWKLTDAAVVALNAGMTPGEVCGLLDVDKGELRRRLQVAGWPADDLLYETAS